MLRHFWIKECTLAYKFFQFSHPHQTPCIWKFDSWIFIIFPWRNDGSYQPVKQTSRCFIHFGYNSFKKNNFYFEAINFVILPYEKTLVIKYRIEKQSVFESNSLSCATNTGFFPFFLLFRFLEFQSAKNYKMDSYRGV